MFFIPSLSGGGAERIVQVLLHRLDRSRFSPSLVLLHPEIVYPLPSDIKPVILKKAARRDFFKMIRALVRRIDRENPDILVSFLDYANILAVLAGLFTRARPRIVVSARTTTSRHLSEARFRMAKQLLITLLYRRCERVICISEGVRKDLEKRFSLPPEKMRVIHNGIDIKEVEKLATDLPDHSWYRPKAQPVVIAAGRLVPLKGFSLLLRAFARVVQKINCRLLILGEGRERGSLEDLSRELGIADRVELAGFQANPFSFLAHSDLFALSSLSEGFGNVILEAMACGTPVVATNCPFGPGEIITSGRDGVLVPPGDVSALAGAVIELLSNSRRAAEMAERAKARARDFKVEAMVASYQSLFEGSA